MNTETGKNLYKIADDFSSQLNYKVNETAVVLAAGHGKRIKSHRSKMLHKIWGVPTVERVYNACRSGIKDINIIIVVGIKAEDVMNVIGKRDSTVFAYQENQNGTGHAVQVALEKIDEKLFDGIVYVLPGDMGLIDKETMQDFREKFISSDSDMMVLTGIYNGDYHLNNYGRIVRVKKSDENGNPAGTDYNKVIEIIEHKDILALPDDKIYRVNYNGRTYSYSRQELLENNEFNSGVYAFKYKKLIKLINSLSSNNVQKEIYITDLISLFNQSGYSVTAVTPFTPHAVMGFNNKSVLKEMDNVAREKVYEKLKDIIEINDPDDFFIHETVVDEIIEMDKKNIPLDIYVGKGVYIGKGVKLNYNINFKRNVFVDGNVHFGQNVVVWQNARLTTFEKQVLKVGNNVEILWGNILKGNIIIGDNSRIESSVRMTGSDEFPLRIGNNALIRGTSYIYGSIVDDGVIIEHSIIIKKKIKKVLKKDGTIQPVKFFIPQPEGTEAINDL